MEQSVKQRLVNFIKYKSLSQKRFEESVGLSNGYINSLRHAPSDKKLRQIIEVYPELNRVWLLTGEGQMINSSDVVPKVEQDVRPYTTNNNGVVFHEQQSGELLMEVPIVPFDALGSMADDYTDLVASREEGQTMMFPVDAVHHGKYFAFVVDNDSMDDGSRDSFQKGDTVLVRELDKQDWLPNLHINKWRFWVVCFGNNIRIKEIVSQNTTEGTITCHSLNPSPEYTDFTLSLNNVSRLFNVIKILPKARSFNF